ncbi:MAG: HAD family hydrolase [Chloroflexi bacterium]|nr:HAD family hydrolase [Chloroflexota bacterium]
MQPITSQSPIQGVIFDFGSTLAVAHAPWPAIIADGAARLTGCLRDAGLTLPPDFADLWRGMLRFANQLADREGVERPAGATLVALLTSQGYDDADPALVRVATDCFFGAEDAVRAPASGAVELLAELKAAGYRLGLLSNTITDRWVQRWADQFGFRPYLDVVATSEALGYRKPRREAFLPVLERLRLADTPDRAVMVGDTPTQDTAGAQALGMRTVQVTLAEDLSFQQRMLAAAPPAAPDIQPDAAITELAGLIPVLERWQADGR